MHETHGRGIEFGAAALLMAENLYNLWIHAALLMADNLYKLWIEKALLVGAGQGQ